MCYLIREQQARAAERGGSAIPPSLNGPRPRWIGAIAAALIGGLAVAALVAPPSTSPPLITQDSAPAPIASTAVTVPTAAVVERGSLPVDDGVPSASDVAKAGMGDCNHGL